MTPYQKCKGQQFFTKGIPDLLKLFYYWLHNLFDAENTLKQH